MRRVFGPRTVVEAAFLVAVPVVAAVLGASTWVIIGASGVAYLLIFVLEATLWREGAPRPGFSRKQQPAEAGAVVPPAPELESVVVVQASAAPGPALAHPIAPIAEPEPTPEPVVAAPPAFVAKPSEHVRVLRPEPEPVIAPPIDPVPEPEPEPVVVAPPLAVVPEPEPLPEPVAPEPVAPAPEPSTVVPIGVSAIPRQWSLWDLERLTRENAGTDVAQDEERQFLLMYLREFADSAGLLPIDFDGLVRDSFGELVGSR